MKKFLKILLVFSLLLPVVSATTAEIAYYDPLPAQAGEFVDVWLSLSNNDPVSTGDLEVELIPKDSFTLAEGEENIKTVDDIPKGKSFYIKYRLKVLDNAVDGTNYIDVKIYNKSSVQTFTLPMQVTNNTSNLQIGSIESTPTKIYPDTDEIQLDITLLNIGEGTANHVKTQLILPDNFEASNSYSDTDLLGNIEGDSSATATFYIDTSRELLPGLNIAQLVIYYRNTNSSDATYLTKTLDVSLPVKSKPIFEFTEIELNPETLQAGNSGKLYLTLQNIGQKEAESVSVKVYEKTEQPFGFKTNSNFISPSMKENETGQTVFEFDIEKDAEDITYTIDLEIRYLVGDDLFIDSKTIQIPIGNKAKSQPGLEIFAYAIIILGIIFVAYTKFTKGKKKK